MDEFSYCENVIPSSSPNENPQPEESIEQIFIVSEDPTDAIPEEESLYDIETLPSSPTAGASVSILLSLHHHDQRRLFDDEDLFMTALGTTNEIATIANNTSNSSLSPNYHNGLANPFNMDNNFHEVFPAFPSPELEDVKAIEVETTSSELHPPKPPPPPPPPPHSFSSTTATTEVGTDFSEVKKNILEDRFWPPGVRPVLPTGWKALKHQSGIYLYFHMSTRTVTLSPPYIVDHGQLKYHEIPCYAIPCLMYKRLWKSEEAAKEDALKFLNAPAPPPPVQSGAAEKERKEDHPAGTKRNNKRKCPFIPGIGESVEQANDDQHSLLPVKRNHLDAAAPLETGNVVVMPPPVLQLGTAESMNDKLTLDEVRNYCETGFQLKEVIIRNFRSGQERTQFFRKRSLTKRANVNATLPDTDLIRYRITEGLSEAGEPIFRDGVIRIGTKPYLAILHEYSTALCKKPATFHFDCISANELAPFRATVFINAVSYASGEGSTKKIAKALAARSTLRLLIRDFEKCESQIRDVSIEKHNNSLVNHFIPDSTSTAASSSSSTLTPSEKKHNGPRTGAGAQHMHRSTPSKASSPGLLLTNSAVPPPKQQLSDDDDNDVSDAELDQEEEEDDSLLQEPDGFPTNSSKPKQWDEAFFDQLPITKRSSVKHLQGAHLPCPRAILLECMKRNFMATADLQEEFQTISNSRRRCIMRLGELHAEVICVTNRSSRQRASQIILSKMYPSIQCWGPLLRMCMTSAQPDKKNELCDIQKLQLREKGGVKMSLIGMLKSKMLQLAEQWEAMPDKGKGKFGLFQNGIPEVLFHPDSIGLEANISNLPTTTNPKHFKRRSNNSSSNNNNNHNHNSNN